jgi:hypothetical protein
MHPERLELTNDSSGHINLFSQKYSYFTVGLAVGTEWEISLVAWEVLTGFLV